MIITARRLRDENSALKRRDLKLITVREAVPATSEQILQGITRAALQTSSFMSAAFSRVQRDKQPDKLSESHISENRYARHGQHHPDNHADKRPSVILRGNRPIGS